MHAHRDPLRESLGGPDQLQREAQLAGEGDVVAGDRGDPLVANVVDVHRDSEREPREDRHLGGRVGPAHVVDGVRFGEAQPLGLDEGVLIVAAAARHLGEDEVRRSVDDAVDPLDARPGE